MIENEYLQVEVEQDGSMSVRHKATGREYRGLNQFEDAGDTGDTYDFCPLPSTDGSTMLCCKPEVALIEHGPLQAALRIQWEFEIPGELTADRKARSTRRVVLPVTSIIRLRVGSPYVEISTSLKNQASDHRPPVNFPTGISSQLIHAGGHMATVPRSAKDTFWQWLGATAIALAAPSRLVLG